MNFKNNLNDNTSIIGVIGHPIKQSYSPFMQNIAIERAGLNFIYLPFDVPPSNLKNALKGVRALGIKGLNVTIPHKEKIIEHLHELSEEAKVIGAVNTVVNDNGTLTGYNTDVNGIMATLEVFKDELSNAEVSVFGAGGAARSVLFTLIRYFNVGRINIINRTKERAELLKDYFCEKMVFDEIRTFELVPPDLTETIYNSKLIVNTTSIGMWPDNDDSPLPVAESFNKNQIVFDTVYNPLKTKMLELAESQEAITLNGLKMFVYQGAKSFELWTGEEMPIDDIYKTLEESLKN